MSPITLGILAGGLLGLALMAARLWWLAEVRVAYLEGRGDELEACIKHKPGSEDYLFFVRDQLTERLGAEEAFRIIESHLERREQHE